MKKLLGLVIFLAVSLFFTTFSYAKNFQKENNYVKINISVIGVRADISVTNTYTYELNGNLAIFDTEPNSNYTNYVFYEPDLNISKGQTKKVTYGGLDASQNKKYTLIYRATNHQRTEVPFSTSWYGIVKGDETSDGGYKLSAFGDKEDQREMSVVLSRSSLFLSDPITFPLGKFTGSGAIRYTNETPISLPPEKSGRYYVGLVAKGVDGSVEIITKYRDQLVFGSDKVGKIFFNEASFDTGKQTLFGSVDITKHRDTDIVPLRTISIEATINKIIDGGAVGEEVFRFTPIPKEKFAESKDGKYFFEIEGNTTLDGNTWYYLVITFKSDTGATASHPYKFNIKKGIVPEIGKAADNFFDKNSYRLLAPIPGMIALLDPALCQLEQQRNPGQICDVNAFLNFILKLIIGLAAVVLVVRLIIEGYSYMITDTPFKKASAKGAFKEALIGLVIALSSYLILNTINPRLVNNDLKIGIADFNIESFGDIDENTVPPIGSGASFNPSKFPNGVLCPGTGGRDSIRTIAGSWQGKATYSQDVKSPKGYPPRGNVGPNNTFMLDCSSYVATVLECAGINPPKKASGISTKVIFEQMAGSEKVSPSDFTQSGDKVFVKGKELLPGDLVGWRGNKKKNKKDVGHVVIYVGGGMFRESQVGGWDSGNSVQKEKSLQYELGAMSSSFQGYIRRVAP